MEVNLAMEIGVYERVNGTYFLTTGSNSHYPWYYFNQSWLSSQVPLEFDVGGCTYISQPVPEVYLCHSRGSFFDLDRNEYPVIDFPKSLFDSFIIRVNWVKEMKVWRFSDVAHHRRRADTKKRITLIQDSMIKIGDMVNFLIVPHGSLRVPITNSVQIKAVSSMTTVERNRCINEFVVPLIRSKLVGNSRNSVVWDRCKSLNFYKRGDIDDYLRSCLNVFVGNNSFGDSFRKRKELLVVRLKNVSFLVTGCPRFCINWVLKYYSYENYRMYFPDFFLVGGKVPYYRVFYAIVDNCMLTMLGLN